MFLIRHTLSSLLQRINLREACLVVCLSEYYKTSYLLQRIRLWEACLVFCLSECNEKSSLLQQFGLGETFFDGFFI